MTDKPRIQILSVRKVGDSQLKSKQQLKQANHDNYINLIKAKTEDYTQKNIKKMKPNLNNKMNG